MDDEPMLYLLIHGGYARVVGEDDNWTVAHEMTGETGRLFAAAPDMLEALREAEQALAYLTSRYPTTFNYADRLGIVRAAIAKATGKESE